MNDKMSDNYYAVILAGGSGTRLWPLSRQNRPKQMLRLVGARTLFEVSVDRLDGLFVFDHILVVTTPAQAVELQKQRPKIPKENYLLEPEPRGTASAIGYAAIVLNKRDPDSVMAVLTADHYIENESKFLDVLRAAKKAAEKNFLVTLGILPTYPATGFGYIHQGNYLATYEGVDVFNALKFKEKPDLKAAQKFLAAEDHSWNSGMFIWRVSKVLSEIQKQLPKLYRTLEQLENSVNNQVMDDKVIKLWLKLEPKTIDYGIMENAEDVAVVPAMGLGWNDVGSWNAIFDVMPPDENGNIVNNAQHVILNSTNSLIFTSIEDQRMIVTIGIDNLVIVDTGDVLLVCDKNHAQDVREVVRILKEQGKNNYL